MAFDRLDAMRAFCRIVELGSFTRAAEALAIAKTTLSGQIQALENQLGVKLLHRTTRRVTATTDGAAYYERARTVLEDIDELEASVLQTRTAARGKVKVDMPSPVGRFLLIPALPGFVGDYPDIQLDLGCSERVVDLVQEGIDCAIRGGVVTDPDLVCRPIGQMRFVLCAAPLYLNENPPVNIPQDLAKLRFLAFVFPASGRQNPVRLNCGDQSVLIEQTPGDAIQQRWRLHGSGAGGIGLCGRAAVRSAGVVGRWQVGATLAGMALAEHADESGVSLFTAAVGAGAGFYGMGGGDNGAGSAVVFVGPGVIVARHRGEGRNPLKSEHPSRLAGAQPILSGCDRPGAAGVGRKKRS